MKTDWYAGFFWGVMTSTSGLILAGFLLNNIIILICAGAIDISAFIVIIIKPKTEKEPEYGFWS